MASSGYSTRTTTPTSPHLTSHNATTGLPLDNWIRSILPTLVLNSHNVVKSDSEVVELIGAAVPQNLGYRRTTVRDRVWDLLNPDLINRINSLVNAGDDAASWRDRQHIEQAVADIVDVASFAERPKKIPSRGSGAVSSDAAAITLPYSLQHAMLAPMLGELEEACWGWCLTNAPRIPKAHGWSCAEAAHLTNWVAALTSTLPPLDACASDLVALRDSVVHRTPMKSDVLQKILFSAEVAARMLGAMELAGRVCSVRTHVENALKEVGRVRREAKLKVKAELERIELEAHRIRGIELDVSGEGEARVLKRLGAKVGRWWEKDTDPVLQEDSGQTVGRGAGNEELVDIGLLDSDCW